MGKTALDLDQGKRQHWDVTFWNWGPTTIWHSIECVAFFFSQNHSTLLYLYTEQPQLEIKGPCIDTIHYSIHLPLIQPQLEIKGQCILINDTVYTPSTHTASSWIKGPVYCIIGWSDIVLFASMHYLILFTQHSVIRYLQIIAFSLTMVVFQYKYKADQNLKIHHDHWSVISILNLL